MSIRLLALPPWLWEEITLCGVVELVLAVCIKAAGFIYTAGTSPDPPADQGRKRPLRGSARTAAAAPALDACAAMKSLQNIEAKQQTHIQLHTIPV